MGDIDRYEIEQGYNSLQRADDGPWVLHADHAAVVAGLEARLADERCYVTRLHASNKELCDMADADRAELARLRERLAEVEGRRGRLYDARVLTLTTIGDMARAAGIKTTEVSEIEMGQCALGSPTGRAYLVALGRIFQQLGDE